MKNQGVDLNIEVLKKIYALYDEAVMDVDTVCREKCSSCCTCNVTLTSLEAKYLMASLTLDAKKRLKNTIEKQSSQKRYVPKMTANMFARLCMEGGELPEEENDPSWGNCPVLEDDMCSLYDGRPFGCRALLSQTDCKKNGYAQVPPFVLTINNVFMQAIEQVDQNGIFGNFLDIMALFLSGHFPENLAAIIPSEKNERFLLNEKISVLMVEPERKKQLSALLGKLSALL